MWIMAGDFSLLSFYGHVVDLHRRRVLVYLLLMGLGAATALSRSTAGGSTLDLVLRSQVETASGSGRFHIVPKRVPWNTGQTAIVVCDMWDDHHCRASARRVAEMASRMNRVIAAARARGVLDDGDMCLTSISRRALPEEQLRVVRRFAASNKPLVALGASSSAFRKRGELPLAGLKQWRDFDRQVLGCRYRGHHPRDAQVTVFIQRPDAQPRAELELQGVPCASLLDVRRVP